jgi:mannosyltransferase
MDPAAQKANVVGALERFNSPWTNLAVAGVIVMAGLAARLYNASYNFDGDEVFSVKLASSPLSEVISQSLADRPHPPLYNLFLHYWTSVFGASELAARSLSVAFSAGFLVTSSILLRHLVSRWVAASALLLLAISPFFVFYGQQARPYALIAFLSAVNLFAYLRVIENANDRRRLIIWAVSSALLIYSQYLAFLVIGLELLWAFWFLTSGRLRVLAFGIGAGLLIVPWTVASMGHSYAVGADPLPEISWISVPTLKDFAWFYVSLFGENPALHVTWLAIALVALGAAYAICRIRRRSLPGAHAFLLALALGIPGLCYLISVAGPKPIFAGRQMMSAALSVFLVISLCLEALPSMVAAVLAGVLALWMTVSLPEAFPQNSRAAWREIARAIDARYGPVDVFTEEQWVYIPLSYYRREGHILLWNRDIGADKLHPIVVVCRPFRCEDFESTALASRRSLIATWASATTGDDRMGTRTLHLYEIAAAQ